MFAVKSFITLALGRTSFQNWQLATKRAYELKMVLGTLGDKNDHEMVRHPMRVCACLPVCLSACLPVFSLSLSMCVCVCLSVFFCPSWRSTGRLYISVSVHLYILYLSVCPSGHLSICQFVRLSVCPSVHLSLYPFVPLSVCPSVHLSTYPTLG